VTSSSAAPRNTSLENSERRLAKETWPGGMGGGSGGKSKGDDAVSFMEVARSGLSEVSP
jgi:hypothetical protein